MSNLNTNPFDLFWDSFIPYTTTTSVQQNASYAQNVTSDAYQIEIPMVGIARDDLSIGIEDNKLTVNARPKTKSRYVKDHTYSWYLNEDSDINNIGARLENGLLMLSIGRVKPVKRTVNIQVN